MQQSNGEVLFAAERRPSRRFSGTFRRKFAEQSFADPIRKDSYGHLAKQQRTSLEQVRRDLLRIRLNCGLVRRLGESRKSL